MGKRMLFLDESGKTGTQRYSEKWNFSNQPYFALCGILVSEQDLNEVNKFVEDLRKNYKIQGEIKSTKETVRKNSEKIISQLWNKQNELHCELFIEVVNKKFCMAMMITNYCVFPYYDMLPEDYNSYEAILLRKKFANYICESISDELLGKFVEFFDNNDQDIDELIQLCCKLIQEIDNEKIVDYINETIDSIRNYDKLPILKHKLFPLVDYYNGKCSAVAICPHVDSFNNILNRVRNLTHLTIIHDNIKDLEEALKQTVKQRGSSNIMQFENSRKFNMLQLADFWCGNVNDYIQKILLGTNHTNSVIEEIIQTRVNFVSTFVEQELLFPDNIELKQIGIWYKDFFKK